MVSLLLSASLEKPTPENIFMFETNIYYSGKEISQTTRVVKSGKKVSWCFERAPKVNGMRIPIQKKEDRSQCTNYPGISLFSPRGQMHARNLEKDTAK